MHSSTLAGTDSRCNLLSAPGCTTCSFAGGGSGGKGHRRRSRASLETRRSGPSSHQQCSVRMGFAPPSKLERMLPLLRRPDTVPQALSTSCEPTGRHLHTARPVPANNPQPTRKSQRCQPTRRPEPSTHPTPSAAPTHPPATPSAFPSRTPHALTNRRSAPSCDFRFDAERHNRTRRNHTPSPPLRPATPARLQAVAARLRQGLETRPRTPWFAPAGRSPTHSKWPGRQWCAPNSRQGRERGGIVASSHGRSQQRN